MKYNTACDSYMSCHTETGRIFTWGRGNYGQLGRHASTSQSSESQSTTDGENLEACLPAEVKALQRATQVRSRLILSKLKHPQNSADIVLLFELCCTVHKLLVQQGAEDTHKYNHAADGRFVSACNIFC